MNKSFRKFDFIFLFTVVLLQLLSVFQATNSHFSEESFTLSKDGSSLIETKSETLSQDQNENETKKKDNVEIIYPGEEKTLLQKKKEEINKAVQEKSSSKFDWYLSNMMTPLVIARKYKFSIGKPTKKKHRLSVKGNKTLKGKRHFMKSKKKKEIRRKIRELRSNKNGIFAGLELHSTTTNPTINATAKPKVGNNTLFSANVTTLAPPTAVLPLVANITNHLTNTTNASKAPAENVNHTVADTKVAVSAAAPSTTPLNNNTKTKTNSTLSKKELRANLRQYGDSLKGIIQQLSDMSSKIDTNTSKGEAIAKSIDETKENCLKLQKEVENQGVMIDYKLNLLNEKMIKQMQMSLVTKSVQIQKEIVGLEASIRTLKIRIQALKSKLPMSSTSVCSNLLSCGACTANPGCGWCSMTQSCVEGNEKGPLNGECTFFDYKVCSGPKECSSYNSCEDCIKDVTCGWCNDFSKVPVCMNKNDAEGGNCRTDLFIHQWKELNSCPHLTSANFKDYVIEELKKIKPEDLVPKNNTIVLSMSPEEKKTYEAELKIDEEELTKKEIHLDRYVKLLNKTANSLKKLDEDEGKFKNLNITSKEKQQFFYTQTHALFAVMKDYLQHYQDNVSEIKSQTATAVTVRPNKPVKIQTKRAKKAKMKKNNNGTKRGVVRSQLLNVTIRQLNPHVNLTSLLNSPVHQLISNLLKINNGKIVIHNGNISRNVTNNHTENGNNTRNNNTTNVTANVRVSVHRRKYRMGRQPAILEHIILKYFAHNNVTEAVITANTNNTKLLNYVQKVLDNMRNQTLARAVANGNQNKTVSSTNHTITINSNVTAVGSTKNTTKSTIGAQTNATLSLNVTASTNTTKPSFIESESSSLSKENVQKKIDKYYDSTESLIEKGYQDEYNVYNSLIQLNIRTKRRRKNKNNNKKRKSSLRN